MPYRDLSHAKEEAAGFLAEHPQPTVMDIARLLWSSAACEQSHEREACARIADDAVNQWNIDQPVCEAIAAAIRARSNPTSE